MSEEQPAVDESAPAPEEERAATVGSDSAPEPLSTRAARELTALEAVLRKTRRQMRSPLLAEGLAWFVATMGAVLVTAQFVGLVLGKSGPEAMRVVLGIGLSATLLGAVVALVGYVRSTPSLEEVARRLQRQVVDFRSDIVAALQFGAALRDGVDAQAQGWSAELAFAHLRRTTRAVLARVDGGGSLAPLLEARSLAPTLAAVGGCLVLLVAPMLVWGERVSALWGEALVAPLVARDDGPDHRPVVGDIDLVFSYPPYTKLPQRVEPFTTGHISTLVGTEVTLKTYPLLRVTKVELVLETADGERTVPMKADEELLEAKLLLTKPGSYRFRATLADGTVVEDGIDRPIVLEPDAAPSVTITSHTGEVEVSPDEVLTLRVVASDDFGLETVVRATAFGGEDPQRVNLDLPELTMRPRELEQEVALDLREFGLQPRDVLTVSFEATDNNSLTGPGVGKAAPLVLRVASPEDRHQRLIAEQMEVLEALLDVLGDFLEHPLGERHPDHKGVYQQTVAASVTPTEASAHYATVRGIHEKQSAVVSTMAGLLERMREDPLMSTRDVTLFESFYEQLYALNRDGAEGLAALAADARLEQITRDELQRLANWVARAEDTLEKGLIRLDNLLAAQKMDAVRRAADEIKELKERLRELLEKYRETQDPELKAAIMREIQRLRQRMAELMAQMSSQLQKIPQEHVNMEALEQMELESEAKKMGESLQSLEELLERGDIDGALQALDDMTASLDEMTKGMGEEGAEPDGLREMDQALSELMDKANDLEARQRELERQTRDQQEANDRREQERMQEMLAGRLAELEALAAEQRAELEAIAARDIAPHDRDAVNDALARLAQLQSQLKSQDVEQALESAQGSRQDLRGVQFSMELAQRYTQADTPRGAALRQSLGDLDKANARGRKIVRQLEEIMDQARSSQNRGRDPRLQELAREQRGVDEQAQQLQRDIEGASERFPMLQQKLDGPLRDAREDMNKADDALQKGKSQEGLDHQRGALEDLRQLKQSMRDALQRQKQQSGRRDGRGGSRQDKVAIPKEDGRSRETFREDVLKGMKQERLQDYESEIERYYESLMQ